VPAELRCTLTLPGAVALGAYEGGALAALLSGLRGIREKPGEPEVRIDSICACSSGSVTALLVARCLVEGLDPVRVLHKAWVTDGSLRPLFASGVASPLDFSRLRTSADGLLSVPSDLTPLSPQGSPVHMSFGLGNLRGLGFSLPAIASPGHLSVTHVDWVDFILEAGVGLDQLTGPPNRSVLDSALASAANQLAFPAQLIRRHTEEKIYLNRGVQNFPTSRAFWYTDGSFLYREPIGRAHHLARQLDAGSATDFERLHVVVEPQPLVAAEGDDWADPARPPSWLDVLRRSAGVLLAQSTFDDLSRIAEVNDRLKAVNELVDRLTPVLNDLPNDVEAEICAALDGDREGDDVDLPKRLQRALAEAADVAGKSLSAVEVIAPAVNVNGVPGPRPLAGKAFFRFAGFLDEHLRQLDFDAGYEDALTWLSGGGLTRHQVSEELTEAAVMTARDAYQSPLTVEDRHRGLPLEGRWDLARLLLRVATVGTYDLLRDSARARMARRRAPLSAQ
jgi:hypothetical protein